MRYFNALLGVVKFIFFKAIYPFSFKATEVSMFGGSVNIGKGACFCILGSCVTRSDSIVNVTDGKLTVGKGLFLNRYSSINVRKKIDIGDNVIIGPGCHIFDHDHLQLDGAFSRNKFECRPVTLGNNVWVGANSCILKGVTIGDDVIIGAGSVVAKDIPSKSKFVGGIIK